MSIHTLIPVKEAFNVNDIACLNVSKRLVNVGIGIGKVALYAEAVGCARLGNGDVDVIAGSTVLVGNLLNDQIVKLNELVLMLDEILGAEKCGSVHSLGYPVAIYDLKGCIHDLNLTCPSALVAGNLDLGTLGQLGKVLLGASHLICEVCAVGILKICGNLIVPPGLSCLNVRLNNNLSVHCGRIVLSVGHYALGLLCGIIGNVRAFGFGFGLRFDVGFGCFIGINTTAASDEGEREQGNQKQKQ